MSNMVSAENLQQMARDTRALYERLLDSSIGCRSTQGSCIYAAILIQTLAAKFLSTTTIVRGGDGELDGGFLSKKGTVHGHYWTEVACPKSGSRWVVDVTTDQFGEAPVRVLLISEAVQYVPGDQAVVDAHVDEQMRLMALP